MARPNRCGADLDFFFAVAGDHAAGVDGVFEVGRVRDDIETTERDRDDVVGEDGELVGIVEREVTVGAEAVIS